MRACELFRDIAYVISQRNLAWEETEVTGIAYHSDCAVQGNVFVCIEGSRTDGHAHIQNAYENGARIFIVEKPIAFHQEAVILRVKNARETLAQLSARWFGFPAGKLKIIGITGTKGKTTTAYMIYHMLKAAGEQAALISTIETIIGEERISSKNTTPESFTIQQYFDKMVRIGCKYVVMEVSSQGIMQKRVAGIPFEIGIFTNLSQDHIGADEHKSMEEYRFYKAQLFKQCKIGIGNLDDPACSYMFRRTICNKYGFSCQKKRQKGHVLVAEEIEPVKGTHGLGMRFKANGIPYYLSMPGKFNVYNALAAIQTLECLAIDRRIAGSVLEDIKVSGRMQEVYLDNNIACYIDYAHNAESLEALLRTIRQYYNTNIILVFGCGGNRSKIRRTLMGTVAGTHADLTIVTSDNPRFENPLHIMEDIAEGLKQSGGRYLTIEERKDAIWQALSRANSGEVVIIAGKGHENYQEIEGVRYMQSDYELVRQWENEQKG